MKNKKDKPKLKDGKLFKFVKEKLPDIAGKGLEIFGDLAGKESIESFGKWIQGEKDLTPNQVEDLNVALDYDLRETEAYLADIANSRAMNVNIQESKKASWLAKNTAYILDFLVITLFAIVLFIVIRSELSQEQKDLALIGLGVLGAKLEQVITFHRGSSQGSKDKTNLLNK